VIVAEGWAKVIVLEVCKCEIVHSDICHCVCVCVRACVRACVCADECSVHMVTSGPS